MSGDRPDESPKTFIHVRRAKKGDASAWDRLVEKIRHEVSRVCARSGVPEGWDVDDVVQIVCAEVFKTIPRFRASESDDFRAWVRVICRQRLVDLARRRKARGRPSSEASLDGMLEESFDQKDDAAHPPSVFARANEIEERSARVVEGLSERQRRALELREKQGLGYEDIAARLGPDETVDAARSLYNHARKKRAAILREYFERYLAN